MANTIVLGALLVIVLLGPFLVPVPSLKGTVPAEQLADPDSCFTNVNGLIIHYKMAGSGERAFFLLHGFAASTFSWREVFYPFSKKGRAVAFDRPGFGLTERPLQWKGKNPYSLDGQVEITVALMDVLGINRAILVGNSAGGTVALLTALTYPQRVDALVLVSPAVYGEGVAEWLHFLLNTPQVNHIGPLLARQIRKRGVDFAKSAWHDSSKITPQIWEGYTNILRIENWDKALWEVTKASRRIDLTNRLVELRVPVLIITGDNDRIVPTEQSIRLAKEIPGARLVVISQCGHVPQEECPEAFLEAVIGFVEDLER